MSNEDFDEFFECFIPEHTFFFNRGQDEIGTGSCLIAFASVVAILFILFEVVFKVLTN